MIDTSQLHEAVKAQIETVEEERLALLDKHRAFKRVALIVLVIVTGLVVSLAIAINVPWWFGVLAGIFLSLFPIMILYFRSAGDDFYTWSDNYKKRVLRPLVSATFPGIRYQPTEGIARDEFERAKLYPRGDRFLSEDLFVGTVGETQIRFSEVTVESDRQGKDRRSVRSIFNGIFLIADFNKHFAGETRVFRVGPGGVPKKSLPDLLRLFGISDESRVILEDPEFEECLRVFASDEVEARYILSPALMRRLLKIEKEWGALSIAFVDSNIVIGIDHGKDWFQPSMHVPVKDTEQLARITQEIRVVLDLVEELNLNTRIWSK